MLIILLNYALLAFTFVLAKTGLQYASFALAIAIRMLLAGTLLCLIALLRNYPFPHNRWRLLFKTAFYHIFLTYTCEFWALQSLTSWKTNLLYSSTPFLIALIGWLLYHEPITRRQKIGLALGFCGLLPPLLEQPTQIDMQWFSLTPADFVLGIAVTSAAYAWFLVRQLLEQGVHPFWINGITMLLGGLGCTLLIPFTDAPLQGIDNPNFWIAILLLIIISNGIFYNTQSWLMRHFSLKLLTFAGLLTPLFGTLYGAVLLHEPVQWLQFATALLCFASGLYYIYSTPRSSKTP